MIGEIFNEDIRAVLESRDRRAILTAVTGREISLAEMNALQGAIAVSFEQDSARNSGIFVISAPSEMPLSEEMELDLADIAREIEAERLESIQRKNNPNNLPWYRRDHEHLKLR